MRWRPDIRLTEAIPGRRDRHELRRALRRAARTTRIEQKRAMTTQLLNLMAKEVQLVGMRAGPTGGSEIVEFDGGVQLLFRVRDGISAIKLLERRMPREGVHIERVQPCFGWCWYRLRFSPPGGSEILARIVPFVRGTLPAAHPRHRMPHRPAADER